MEVTQLHPEKQDEEGLLASRPKNLQALPWDMPWRVDLLQVGSGPQEDACPQYASLDLH